MLRLAGKFTRRHAASLVVGFGRGTFGSLSPSDLGWPYRSAVRASTTGWPGGNAAGCDGGLRQGKGLGWRGCGRWLRAGWRGWCW